MSPKIWLITGANSGLGLALARYVLSQGDKVIAAARDISRIPTSLGGAQRLALNPSAPEAEIRAAANEALKIHGRIDVLVNNAGYALTGPVEELVGNDIQSQFQTNVFGPITLIQALLPSFRAQKSGHIINVSSIAAFAGGPGFGAYNASKSALEKFTEVLSLELAPFGIRVHIVEPGFFPTNFLTAAAASKPRADQVLTGVYTEPSQGYGGVDNYEKNMLAQGQVGDKDLAAARLYEFVVGTGLAKGLVEGSGGRREWVRLPLGSDSGRRIKARLSLIAENVNAYEPIWSSTDVEKERIEDYMKQLQ